MKKKLIISAGIIIIIIIAIAVYLFNNLDSIAKSIIEKAVSEVTGTTATVGKVNISLSEGKAALLDFKIANPQGFTDASMISFKEISAQIKYKTLAITNINIKDPFFLFEQKGASSNFDFIQKYLNNKSVKKGTGSETGKDGSGREEKEKTYKIDSFNINNAHLTFKSLDTGQVVKIIINNMHFNELEGTPDQIAQQVFTQLTAQIMSAVAMNVAQKQIEKNVGGKAGEIIGNTLKNILNK
ncbi:MAG TPA: hypothetical protein QF753_03725 [Victivallales bacterium]|nr:hypothetical protein [Victivallales bacterium]